MPPLANTARPSDYTSVASNMPCTSSATEWWKRGSFWCGNPADEAGGVIGPDVTGPEVSATESAADAGSGDAGGAEDFTADNDDAGYAH